VTWRRLIAAVQRVTWRQLISAAVVLVLVALVAALFLAPLEPAVQGGIVGGLLGLIASTVALFVQRRLREHGEVICEVSAWTDAYAGRDPRFDYYEEPEPDEYVEIRYFRVRFHNQKDVSIALWDIKVEFSKEGKEQISLEPWLTGSNPEVEPLNLPSREAMYLDLKVQAESDDKQRVKEADKAELVMTVAGGGELRKELPHWSDLEED
jgi:hypothetical protein